MFAVGAGTFPAPSTSDGKGKHNVERRHEGEGKVVRDTISGSSIFTPAVVRVRDARPVLTVLATSSTCPAFFPLDP